MTLSTASTTIYLQPEPKRRARIARWIGKPLYYLMVLLVVGITFFPIYWMVLSTVRPSKYSTVFPPKFYPQSISFKPFRQIFADYDIGRWLINSAIVSSMATIICIVLSILGAYTISMLRWKGRTLFAAFLLVTQMLPETLIVVPVFRLFSDFGFRDNLLALAAIDAAFILPIGVWVLKNLFDTVPHEVQEAALVDGAGPIRVLVQIVLPITLPGLVAVGVVAFFYAWNEYLFAQTLISDKSLKPASAGLASMITMLDTPIERLLAAGLIFAIPPVIFYLFMQRYIVAGISAGAVKG
ncbi:MAG: carbohydrate ABC transporter permease [Thermomicrobiales bacterium]